jgi:hypothetical protein
VRINVASLEDRSRGESLAREAMELANRTAEASKKVTEAVERALV